MSHLRQTKVDNRHEKKYEFWNIYEKMVGVKAQFVKIKQNSDTTNEYEIF